MHHGDCRDACFTGFTARPPCQAENEEVGYAGWQLACLLACRAASFDIALTEHVTSARDRDQPALLRLLTVLEDLDGFLTKLQKYLAGVQKTEHEQLLLKDLKVHPGRLRKAVTLFGRFAHIFHRSQGDMSDSGVATRLAELLAERFPEQVAVCNAEGNWYAGGCRVRGEHISRHEKSTQVFLVNPGISRPNRSDWNQESLKPAFCLSLVVPPASTTHVNIISDSTLANSAFLYGIARKLWSMGMFLLWTGVQPGAKAADLSKA